ncbi:hypothetical protein OESDEN_14732 [Oesophagostomum dentatum]|uniref:Uncharacterized protein n=1 Tax=Oesophagostomum dentatum TaxID=61180 RepID=A0A0B1SJM7_OESDE|nr:hypothetical protein OESDEN_14732 [Oesophagostomum dentatum]
MREIERDQRNTVFRVSKVKTQFYSVSEALARHRELQQPSIYNHPNAPLRLRLELNMQTERQVFLSSQL